ncbi:hypothetical protein C8A00DRAFT_12638 [Chaetomidium leptoderma]|uniref:Protein SQS1 n=1 Tax=Chaetomidium leptoderma TaxID=669021 RepID=A0AAN6VT50_9PEZI|nr:hypothetical protein C8A00DRAFT_12638 [Chaetomidium leptoderma]
MPPKRGKWPSPRGKVYRGRASASRGGMLREDRDFFPTSTPSNGFSMRDEARNTASHEPSMAWTLGTLRQKPVTFVSAGVVEPLTEKNPACDPSGSNMAEESAKDATEAVGDTMEMKGIENPGAETTDAIEIETITETVEQETLVSVLPVQVQFADGLDQPSEAQGSEPKELFFFDLGEDQPMTDPSIPPPKIPSPRSSFGGSDSSEEIILFRGRTANPRGTAQGTGPLIRNVTAAPSETPVECKPEATIASSNKPASQSNARPTQPSQKRLRSRKRLRAQAPKVIKDDDEDAILADRIANLAANSDDDDEEAILADYIANMEANSDDDSVTSQLQTFSSHRDLGGDDTAVNFGSGNEKSPRGDDSLNDKREGSMDSGISDAEGDDFMNRNEDQEMDADMDDETLARLFAKQEELGMGGDDLLLFTSPLAKTETRKAQGKRTANAGSSRALYGPASATQVADAFDNLDLDGWSQLTGQSLKRRSKQPPNFNVSDSEIEAALRTSWQRDRERKKSRKLERETLRAEGMLGKNANPDDLRVKYLTGMKLDDIKAELTSFLLSSAERLDFPPLDKNARKVLHELANKFNVKSQSIGKGDQRRPVLYRTNRTVRYASTRFEDASSHVDQAALRIHRKYFHRVDVKVQRTEYPRNAGGGRGHKALTLQEGEIVGASVPELSQENKGRTMLEKMGWSKGMSLGALDNNGILEPVAQVMKRGKAGLG